RPLEFTGARALGKIARNRHHVELSGVNDLLDGFDLLGDGWPAEVQIRYVEDRSHASGRDDEIREMGRDAGDERGRNRLHRIARHLTHPFYQSHARIDHHDAQGRNAHTSAVLKSQLDGEQRVPLTLETDESAYLRR